jgi:flagellar basal-body rod modification protein FlgD
MFMTPLTSAQIETFNAKGGANAESADPQAAQDRFLKLLVTQLNNQDPLNPLDNAQMTSQMAQINTVTGIQQLNQTIKGMAAQFSALQNMQGVSLVGRQVVTEGNLLSIGGGVAQGSLSLAGRADSVRVDVMGKAGQLLGTVQLGARSAGMHSFEWSLDGVDAADVGSFRVSAQAAGEPVTAVPLSRQRIESVGMVDGSMRLRTEAGLTLLYDQVLAFM